MSEPTMTATAARGLTVEEFWALPEPPVGERHQLIDGEVVVAASPVWGHQRLVGQLLTRLHDQLGATGAMVMVAPLDVVLGPRTVVQPDVLVFDAESVAGVEHTTHPAPRPTIAIEVLSPSTARVDMLSKRRRYERAGIPEYWIVDGEAATITVLRLVEGHYTDVAEHGAGDTVTTPLFPDVAIDVAEVCEARPAQ